MNRIRSKDHRIGTYEIKKMSLLFFDDKMYIQNGGYDGLAWIGLVTRVNYKKTVMLITS